MTTYPYVMGFKQIHLSSLKTFFQKICTNPFEGSYIVYTPVVYNNGSFIYFGGYTDSNSQSGRTIVSLDSVTFVWNKLGMLNQGRFGHNVINTEGHFLVLGGFNRYNPLISEKCKYANGTIECTTQLPLLVGYELYPELLTVPNDFCKVTLE